MKTSAGTTSPAPRAARATLAQLLCHGAAYGQSERAVVGAHAWWDRQQLVEGIEVRFVPVQPNPYDRGGDVPGGVMDWQ